ncbi:Asp23/Gls24 family envelope stress response protein [Microbacterium sp. APC 3898]|uniref:Asp23/Gls24 family envelope stress response protein n=2 Tax=Planococcus TaxID=1372 RepID=A0ABT7ZI23_9BACL|nr:MULTISPECIES: Asp23/Gls24 family envelope stress response protein [Terrabacteria group]MBF6632917.1 Asp23/Gls24 family envelope stress response protein [Planococcus sp. (in: firmicutes)]MBD8015675.1 Asp23/Gls24 family envelope stress response protein [Planococcus wigleyi]MDN3426794.1 Asp23/Gls24 family envelope stress response protein [Planococcus sp. APC 4016]MDN3438049.1 Asp23/Gls24 family envelope stress response protein [Planococcus sp. APC 3900]MDN3500304.1 Asp23/Gls24 family envelope 
MAEKTAPYVRMKSHGAQDLGNIEVAPEVLEIIASIAATDIEGVASMRGNFASGVVERLGKKVHGKGIKTDLSEEGLAIDVYCVINYGVSIPKTALKIQEQVRQTLENMTSLQTQEVNVHITGVNFEAQAAE